MKYIENSNGLITIGDTHGNFKLISRRVKSLQLNDFTLIHVGDFGVGFYDEHKDIESLNALDKVLIDANCKLYVIRGNHDKPYLFNGEWSNQFKNITLVKDYSVLNVNNKNVLLVGGAISIDRRGRKKQQLEYANIGIDKESYWYDELFELNEELLKEFRDIEYVVTHSCPAFCSPVNSFTNEHDSHGYLVEQFARRDSMLKDDLNKERINISKMYDILIENNKNIKKWIYGHFHRSHKEVHNNIEFITLNVDEFLEIKL